MLQGMSIGAVFQQAVRRIEDEYKNELAVLAKWSMEGQIKCGQQNRDKSARAFKPLMTFDDYEEVTVDIEDAADLEIEVPKVPSFVRSPKVHQAQVTLPQDLFFKVPEEITEDALCIAGPHGPFFIDVPKDAKPGQESTYRLGPDSHSVVVPEGAEPGSMVNCEVDGKTIQVTVPEGKAPGDSFEVVPPAVVVLVPAGAIPGDLLEFPAPDGRQLTVPVPHELRPGQYFSLHLSANVTHIHVVTV